MATNKLLKKYERKLENFKNTNEYLWGTYNKQEYNLLVSIVNDLRRAE